MYHVNSLDWQYLTKMAGTQITCKANLPEGVILQFWSATGWTPNGPEEFDVDVKHRSSGV